MHYKIIKIGSLIEKPLTLVGHISKYFSQKVRN